MQCSAAATPSHHFHLHMGAVDVSLSFRRFRLAVVLLLLLAGRNRGHRRLEVGQSFSGFLPGPRGACGLRCLHLIDSNWGAFVLLNRLTGRTFTNINYLTLFFAGKTGIIKAL